MMWRTAILMGLLAVAIHANDIFRWDKGLEAPYPGQPTNTDRTTTAEFLAHSRGIRRTEDGLIVFHIPREDKRLNYRYVGLGPFPVAALHHYALTMKLSKPRAENALLTLATFFDGEQTLGCHPILTLPSGQYHGLELTQAFVTPPGSDSMILWLGLSAMGKGPLRPGDKLLFETFAVRDAGALPNSGIGTVMAEDFAAGEPGAYAAEDFHFGSREATLAADVVEIGGNRALRIVREDGQYPFPHYGIEGIKPGVCWVEWRFRARGSGTIAAGLWFWLPDRSWHYGAGNGVELTNEWQEVRFGRFCVDPAVRGFGAAFHLQSPNGEFTVDDLHLEVRP